MMILQKIATIWFLLSCIGALLGIIVDWIFCRRELMEISIISMFLLFALVLIFILIMVAV